MLEQMAQKISQILRSKKVFISIYVTMAHSTILDIHLNCMLAEQTHIAKHHFTTIANLKMPSAAKTKAINLI